MALAGEETLTAFDITTMDLLGTELVMLTVCETPAGLTLAWSKVSGLLSASVQAGARNVVLSLCAPPRRCGRSWCMAFYRSLQEGRSPAEALRQARLAIRARHPEPRFWAGWVCVGEVG